MMPGDRESLATRRSLGLLAVLAAFPTAGAVAREVLPDTAYQEWGGRLERRTLDDGSVLSEYVTRTVSPAEPDVTLSVGFVPRFDCSPLIGIRVVGDLSAELGAALDDGDRVSFAIDGEGTSRPVLVDDRERTTMLWFDDAADGRERMRRRLDGGTSAELGLPGGATVTFSLLGSQRSSSATQVACRTQKPLPFEPSDEALVEKAEG